MLYKAHKSTDISNNKHCHTKHKNKLVYTHEIVHQIFGPSTNSKPNTFALVSIIGLDKYGLII